MLFEDLGEKKKINILFQGKKKKKLRHFIKTKEGKRSTEFSAYAIKHFKINYLKKR